MVRQTQEKLSVKAGLAIYTHVLGVSGQYESVALMLSQEMDFNCCANRDSFANLVTYNDLQNIGYQLM